MEKHKSTPTNDEETLILGSDAVSAGATWFASDANFCPAIYLDNSPEQRAVQGSPVSNRVRAGFREATSDNDGVCCRGVIDSDPQASQVIGRYSVANIGQGEAIECCGWATFQKIRRVGAYELN